MAYKCLFAIVFLACQVHTQASVEVQSGTSLLFTLAQDQPEHQTGASSDYDGTETCQLIEVAAKSACNGQRYGNNVKITIPSSTPSLPSHAAPQCPSCHVTFCPSWPALSYHSSPAPQCPSCPVPQCPTLPACPTCPTSPPPPVLFPGYERVPNLGCYKYHTTRTSWTDAKRICEEEGSHLLILNSESESEAIVNIMKRDEHKVESYKDASWLGLMESNTTQHQYWTIFGDPLSSTGFSRWSRGRPRYTVRGDNVYLNSDNGGLYNQPGYQLYAFTCEQFTC